MKIVKIKSNKPLEGKIVSENKLYSLRHEKLGVGEFILLVEVYEDEHEHEVFRKIAERLSKIPIYRDLKLELYIESKKEEQVQKVEQEVVVLNNTTDSSTNEEKTTSKNLEERKDQEDIEIENKDSDTHDESTEYIEEKQKMKQKGSTSKNKSRSKKK